MGTFRVCNAILWFLLCQNFAVSTTWVDQLTNYISDDSDYRLVNILTNIRSGGERLKGNTLEKFTMNLMSRMLTVHTNFEKTSDLVDPATLHVTENAYVISATATFFVLIRDSVDNWAIEDTKTLVDGAVKISAFQYHPKFLLLSKVSGLSGNLSELLSYAWSKNLLDFTVVEFIEQKIEGMENWNQIDNTSPIVHLLNPFKNEYKRFHWPHSMDELFPDKLINLNGHTLNVCTLSNIPASVFMYGFNDRLLGEKLAIRFNASISEIWLDSSAVANMYDENFTNEVLFSSLEEKNVEIFLVPTTPHSLHRNETLRTMSAGFERYCLLVPIMKETKIFINVGVFYTFFIFCVIVLIYWAIKRILNFDTSVWTIFNICCVIFGFAASRTPTRNIERIIYTTLFATAIMYSGDIYSAMTNMALEVETEIPFDSFDDLDKSGLIPIVHKFYANRVFQGDSPVLASLRNKTITYVFEKNSSKEITIGDCVETMLLHQNVSCAMPEKFIPFVEVTALVYGKHFKLAKPYLLIQPTSYTVRKNSPYRQAIDNLILQMQSSGITLEEPWDKKPHKYLKTQKKELVESSSVKKSLMILIIGYTLSTIVFIAEIIWYHRHHR